MKILITGSSGLLGKEVVKVFKQTNNKTILINRKKKIKKKNNFYCNLNNHNNLKKILYEVNPDIIINLAADINFKKKKKKMMAVNSVCPEILAKYCKKNNKHLIHTSTISIHKKSNIYSKNSKIEPSSYYAKTKLLGDKKIIRSNCNYTIIRFGGIFGTTSSKVLKINVAIKQAIQKIPLRINYDLSKRNYTFVTDAAKFIKLIIMKKLFGIYYIGGEVKSFNQMYKIVNDTFMPKNNIFFRKKKIKRFNQIIKNNKIFKYTKFDKAIKLLKKR